MRLSTFVSSSTRAACVLIGGCVLVALTVEMTARLAFDRVSKTQRRTVEEYILARTIGRESRCERRHMLIVGNSLLDEGVRFEHLRDAVAGQWHAERFVVEQTFYFDWYYGLKRLLTEGARPDVVVVMLSTRQWTRSDIRGDYSAYYLMNTRDVPSAARDLGLGATQATNLFFANVSKFWGARSEMRNFILGRVMPDLGRLMDFSSQADPRPLVDDEVERMAGPRLARLKALTDAYGTRLVILLPTLLEVQDGANGFLRAAGRAVVPTLRPVVSGTFGRQLYRDVGFHTNAAGASIFTERLIPLLQNELAAMTARVPKEARETVSSASFSGLAAAP
jgi:hypothetical protein